MAKVKFYTQEQINEMLLQEEPKGWEGIVGTTKHKLTVIAVVRRVEDNGLCLAIKCDCGRIVTRKRFEFLSERTKSCGGKGCKVTAKKLSQEEFEKKVNERHNGYYDLSESEYKGSDFKVKVICPEHGEFWTYPSTIYSGFGCRACGYNKVAEDRTSNLETFIEMSRKRHGCTYDYSKVNYENAETKVTVTCSTHGDFKVKPSFHISGTGWPRCTKVYMDQETFIDKCNKIHNYSYDYSQTVYKSMKEKVIVICKDHGPWEVSAGAHSRKTGCPTCATSGFDRKRPTSFYITYWYGFGEDYIKFGICNKEAKDRVRQQSNKASLDYKILYEFRLDKGDIPRKIELYFLRNLDCGVCPKQWLPDGYTETTHVENLPKILDYIKTNYGLDPEDYKYKE